MVVVLVVVVFGVVYLLVVAVDFLGILVVVRDLLLDFVVVFGGALLFVVVAGEAVVVLVVVVDDAIENFARVLIDRPLLRPCIGRRTAEAVVAELGLLSGFNVTGLIIGLITPSVYSSG